MRFSAAFHETMNRFDLKGSEIARIAGLTNAQVSNFRNGQNLRIDSVEKILAALPNSAREYMLLLVGLDDDITEIPLPKKSEEE